MTVRVKLSRVYQGFGVVSEAVVSEPTGGLYLDLGEPYERQTSSAGEPVIIENTNAVKGYVEACVAFPGESDPIVVLRQLSIADIRAVKDAVMGFFEVGKASAGSSTSSPSAPAGPPTPSSE